MQHSKEEKKLLSLTGKAIAEYKMIQNNDRILVGISGGKDSFILMHLLQQLQRKAPIKFELIAVTIDAGFKNFPAEKLQQFCQQQNWKHSIIQFPIKQILQEKNAEKHPCSLCSRLRRGQLYKAADLYKCNKIALGQHLDDICVSLLLSIFHGKGIKTMPPIVPADSNSKTIIRPLSLATEKLIQKVAQKRNIPIFDKCDYKKQIDNNGDRSYLEKQLSILNQKFPHIQQNMLHAMQNIQPHYLLDQKFYPQYQTTLPNNQQYIS